jgi:hypothetical protein
VAPGGMEGTVSLHPWSLVFSSPQLESGEHPETCTKNYSIYAVFRSVLQLLLEQQHVPMVCGHDAAAVDDSPEFAVSHSSFHVCGAPGV